MNNAQKILIGLLGTMPFSCKNFDPSDASSNASKSIETRVDKVRQKADNDSIHLMEVLKNQQMENSNDSSSGDNFNNWDQFSNWGNFEQFVNY